MSKKNMHLYNVLVLIVLTVFNAFVIFGAEMSQDGASKETWILVIISLLIWCIFYVIQLLRLDNRGWRITWFMIMLHILVLWETGVGMVVIRFLVN